MNASLLLKSKREYHHASLSWHETSKLTSAYKRSNALMKETSANKLLL